MQGSTPQFGAAISAGSVTVVRPDLRVGWSGEPAVPSVTSNPLTMVDSFGGRTVNPGWGTSSDGQFTWTTVGAVAGNFRVDSGASSMIMATRGESMYTYIPTRTYMDSRVRFRTRMNTAVTVVAGAVDQIFVSSGACFRMNTADPVSSHYEVQIASVGSTGQLWIRMFRRLSGTGTYELITQTLIEEITHVATNVYWIEAECAGDILRAKTWVQTDPEPDEYQAWFIGDTSLQGVAGYNGIHSWNGKNTTMALSYANFFVNYSVVDLRVLGDMGELQGSGFQVNHSLDDGMPDGVTSSAGSDPTGSMSTDLVGTGSWDARRTFSPFNIDSPYARYPRDVAGVQLDHGIQTSIGPERMRLFTGQMANLPLKGREASMDAISATRTKLMKSITLPIVNGDTMGLNASWILSYTLMASGIPLSPYPDTRGLVWWQPMHGSTRPFFPALPDINTAHTYRSISATGTRVIRPEFRTDATFFMGLDAGLNTSGYGTQYEARSMNMSGFGVLNRNNTQGRMQFIIRKPDVTTSANWFDFTVANNYGVNPRVRLYITSARVLMIDVEDGTGANGSSQRVFNTGVTIPNDSNWHSVGFYWNLAGNELRVRVDGADKTIIPSPAFVITSMAIADSLDPGSPIYTANAPLAEVQWITGVYANPSLYGWNDFVANTTPGSTVAAEDFEDTTYAITFSGSWARSNVRAHAGTWSLKSATIGNNAASDVIITVPATSVTVTFWYFTSTENNYDKLQVIVNGLVRTERSGISAGWGQITVDVNGVTTVTVRYIKDAATTGGDDAIYIDDVVFTTASSNPVTQWDPQAIIRPVDLELVALVHEGPQEAWQIIAEIAQATLSAMRTDEFDRINILPPSYFSETAQMTVVDTISTELNAQDPDVVIDPSKIRNSIRVDFQQTRIDQANTFVLAYKTSIEVPPGRTERIFAFDTPAISIDTGFTQFGANTGSIESLFSVNSTADGGGAYQANGRVTVRTLAWDARSITLEFINYTTTVLFIVNNFGTNMPYLGVAGKGVIASSASASTSDIRGVRGERTLTHSSPIIQTRTEAQNLAGMILGKTVNPSPEVTVTVFGDPRRQPGDLVSLVDPQGTQIMGMWRIMSIVHTKSGAGFTQTIKLIAVGTPALWDTAGVGWDEGTWSN